MKDQQEPHHTDASSSSEASAPNRRSFLGGIGALGFGMLAAGNQPAFASDIEQAEYQRLKSIGKVNVTRQEAFDVPGGKEHFFEWQVSDDQDLTKKFFVHTTRVEGDGTYTMTTNLRIQTFAPGASLTGTPTATKQEDVTIFATKGEVTGSTRQDKMTITTMYADGSTSRQTLTVPVRLDLSEFANQDFATIIANAGKKYLSGQQ